MSGLSHESIDEIADLYIEAKSTIICYGMGITQHQHGTKNVQQLVNLLLLKGNIGREGAGICPLRGHSNVQGDRTVGITENHLKVFLIKLNSVLVFVLRVSSVMLQLPVCKRFIMGVQTH